MSRKIKNKRMAKLLIQMGGRDQQARKLAVKDPSLWKQVAQVDQRNLERLKQIVRKLGWPTTSLVGKRASHMAWLLVQHADYDVEFQEQCLKLLTIAEKTKDAKKQEVAFLTDRVLVNKGKPQLYGTQFYVDNNGKILPKPIRNINLLEQRRTMMELESVVEYQKQLERR